MRCPRAAVQATDRRFSGFSSVRSPHKASDARSSGARLLAASIVGPRPTMLSGAGGWVMKIRKSVRAYERWLRAGVKGQLVEKDVERKRKLMRQGPFPFLRATYWRWAETILDVCPDLGN